MKKILLIVFIIIFFIFFNYKNDVIIPNNSIRFRVIANSDSQYDQDIKTKVRLSLEEEIKNTLNGVTNREEAKNILENTIPVFKANVKNTLDNNNYNLGFDINFGYNYFPEKKYKGVTYKAGEYESLVVTLGKGEGSNFWCVMFPPLCLIEAEDDYDSSNTEYRFFIKDLIDKYF